MKMYEFIALLEFLVPMWLWAARSIFRSSSVGLRIAGNLDIFGLELKKMEQLFSL